MGRSFEQVIRDAKAKRYDARASRIQGSYRFDIEGRGSYRLYVDHGHVELREDRSPADCVITLDAEEFVLIVDGQQDLLTAYMQGRVHVEGDLALAKAFHGAMRTSPPRAPREVLP
jgi:putative sterol carrier protein